MMLDSIRKIRSDLFANRRITNYLAYALGEILLIVIGILIALKINNWNITQINIADEKIIYQGIKRQILKDQTELTNVIQLNQSHLRQFELAKKIIDLQNFDAIDTLVFFTMNLSQFSDFHRSSNIYETLVNSDNLRLIRNKSFPGLLQELEMIYNHINKLEDIHWDIILNELSPELRGVINYSSLEVMQKERLYSVELQNIFVESIYLVEGKAYVYQQALAQIQSILQLMETEAGGNLLK